MASNGKDWHNFLSSDTVLFLLARMITVTKAKIRLFCISRVFDSTASIAVEKDQGNEVFSENKQRTISNSYHMIIPACVKGRVAGGVAHNESIRRANMLIRQVKDIVGG